MSEPKFVFDSDRGCLLRLSEIDGSFPIFIVDRSVTWEISQYRLPSAVLAISIITLCECILGACRSIASGINRRVACEYAAVGISSYGIERGDAE